VLFEFPPRRFEVVLILDRPVDDLHGEIEKALAELGQAVFDARRNDRVDLTVNESVPLQLLQRTVSTRAEIGATWSIFRFSSLNRIGVP
jgi:hypothetical protein